jgi:hypothetical protein
MTNEPSIERFYWTTPDDVLAITHDGSVAQPPLPEGIESLAGTPLKNQVAILTKIRDAYGNEIGIASELEWLTDDNKLQVYFTITLPNRGVLVAHEVKDYAHPDLLTLFGQVQATGEPWSGHMPVVGTCGPGADGRGVIIAGTGDFAGATGSMIQTMNFREISATGASVDNEETYYIDARG